MNDELLRIEPTKTESLQQKINQFQKVEELERKITLTKM